MIYQSRDYAKIESFITISGLNVESKLCCYDLTEVFLVL
jgi:hypothetical protein